MIDATAESSFAPWRKASLPRPPRRPKGGTAGFFEEPAGGSGYEADCTTPKAWRVGISRQAPSSLEPLATLLAHARQRRLEKSVPVQEGLRERPRVGSLPSPSLVVAQHRVD